VCARRGDGRDRTGATNVPAPTRASR
jgi:hypothetical protein